MNRLLTIVDTKYQRLEYLESTGTQYIDTGIKASHSLGIDITFQNLSSASDGYVFGSSDTFNVNMFALIHYVSGNSNIFYLKNTNFYFLFMNQSGDEFKKTRFVSMPSGQDRTFMNYVEGVLKTNTSHEDSDSFSSLNIRLFSSSGSTNHYVGKIYSCQIYDNGVLVRNFIPVLRKSDNELGMLDLVEGKFYGNAGTGKFTANLDTMYAIIQGSPTVQDGRVSNFSSSNYLETNYVLNSTDHDNIEMQIKFKTPTTIASGNTNIITSKDIGSVNTIRIYKSTNPVIVAFGNDVNSPASGQNIYLQEDTWYILKFQSNSTNQYAYLYNIDGSLKATCLSDNKRISINDVLTLGGRYGNAIGSIDLNRSYIKIDDTKYNLQAVVGYTVVGSPTISDGVVSGFSASDYLQLPSKPDYNDNFEMQVEFTKTATGNCGLCVGGTYTYGGLMVSNNTVRFAIRLDDGTSNTYTLVSNNTIEINALYIANVKRVENKIVLKIYKNGTLDEEIGEDLTNIAFSTNIENLRLGVRVGGDALSGSMNLNNTYIKINNKLWFNGQPA